MHRHRDRVGLNSAIRAEKGWRDRRESDSQVTCRPKWVHARAREWTDTLVKRNVRTTTTPSLPTTTTNTSHFHERVPIFVTSLSWCRGRFPWSRRPGKFPSCSWTRWSISLCCWWCDFHRCRRGEDSRAPTVAGAAHYRGDELRWGFFRALHTGTGQGAVSTGTRVP